MYFPEREDFYVTDDDVCSNFDGIINENVVTELINNNCRSSYPAWNFCATVYHQDNKFHCIVRQYHCIVGEHEYDSMEELRDCISSMYGYD